MTSALSAHPREAAGATAAGHTDAALPLSCSQLRVNLGGRTVLDDISLDIEAGSVTVLLGPNGAGKTTLVKSLLGVLPLASGSVEARGERAYVPQRSEMEWDFPATAHDVVMLGLIRKLSRWRSPGKEHYKAVAHALSKVRMDAMKDRPIGEMSGGQRQRVMIARALVLEPSVLLLDEPFTGLDMPSQELLSDLFVSLAREGCAVVMSTHDLTHALHVADRVVLLNRRVIADAPPSELRDPELWRETFRVSEHSPLLTHVASAVDAESKDH